MKTFVGLLVLSLAIAISASPHLSRVVGGSDAPDGKYPYQVSLWKNGNFHCGGSIINERHILTAAHCIHGWTTSEITVGVGHRLLNETVDLHRAEKLIPHNEFNQTVPNNDIGLIRLAKKLVYGDKIKPIPMTVQDFTRDDYPVTLTGWGRLDEVGIIPNCLQEIELRILDANLCRRIHNDESWPVGPQQICTLTKWGEGVCNGDSGGPLVVDGYQIGIVSWLYPCARGRPDVYTRVHAYLDWIAENTDDERQ